MDPTASLAELLKSNGVPEPVLAELRKEPFKITTLKQFANFFETEGEVNSLFCQQVNTIKDEGDVVANLKQAWREAETTVQRGVKRLMEGLEDEAIDDPLRIEVAENLQKTWTKNHVAEPPAAWMGPPGMLGQFHREFVKRLHVALVIRKMKTLDSVVSMVPNTKRTRLSDRVEISVNQGDNVPEVAVTTCFLYILALKVLLYTMAMAGCYNVANEGEDPKLFASLEPLTQHLADAETYVGKYSGGKGAFSDWAILSSLREIDETIRNEWARLVRKGKSLAEACSDSHGFAGSLWMTKPTRSQGGGGHQGGSSLRGGGGQSGNGGNRSHSSKGPPQNQYLSKGGPKAPARDNNAEKYGSTFKTTRQLPGGKKLCKPHNDGRGCKNNNCRDAHACDVLLPSNVACGDTNHNRLRHRGPTVPLP